MLALRHMVLKLPGVHYDPNIQSSPVVCDVTIRTMFGLAIMAAHPIHVVDVQDAVLNGEFEDDEKIYMVVPKGFERFFNPETTILLLVRALYGLIHAAIAFWRKVVLALTQKWVKRCKAYPCGFYSGQHKAWRFGWLL